MSLSAASGLAVSVNYATSNGTATGGQRTTRSDERDAELCGGGDEPDDHGADPQRHDLREERELQREPERGGECDDRDAQGVGTILDDGTGGGGTDDDTPSFTVSDITRNEGDGTASFTVTLTGDTALSSTINYATANDTASAGADYTATSGTLTFLAGTGVRTQTVTVPIINDSCTSRARASS